jgi:flagellar motor switch protein FliN/FliY
MSSDLVQAFVDSWLRGFLETFEAQSGAPISDEGLPDTAVASGSGLVGLEQPLDQMPGGAFWVGVTEDQAEEVGKLLAKDKAAGKASREALFDVLRSSIGAAVRVVAPKFQLGNAQEIALKTFDAAEANCFTPVRFSASGVQFEIYIGISPQLRQMMEQRAAAQRSGGSALDQLFDFELPVSFSFGRKKLALKDVLKLAPSSVVELDRAPDDLVEVIVNDAVIAWGEVVSIGGQYGIRIRRIAPGGLRAPAMNASPAPVVKALAEA